jgi:hypothetical protein
LQASLRWILPAIDVGGWEVEALGDEIGLGQKCCCPVLGM